MPKPKALWLACTAFLLSFLGMQVCQAEDLLSADKPIEQAVDHYVSAKWKQAGVAAAPVATDAEILRRTTLDLVGRVPTLAEYQAYVDADTNDKRGKLVDRLMESPGYERHQVYVLDTMLMQTADNKSLRPYLEKAVAENRSWDRIFREVMLPEPDQEATKGSEEFLKARLNDIDTTTAEVSVLFFGVNVSCAQCHDHPYVGDWTQEFYYGMKSFMARSFDNGGYIAERDHGMVEYTTNAGESLVASVRFISGTTVDVQAKEQTDEEKKKEKEHFEKFKKDKKQPPLPGNSLRKQLVEIALDKAENHYFAKAMVNRVWARLMGHGLVMPLDQMHASNPPSHPELLDWLARDFITHGYDLRRLTRGIVLSEAYTRSSLWNGGTKPAAELFAVGSVRPLSPFQYAASLKLAATTPTRFAADQKAEDIVQRLEQNDNAARGWLNEFEIPSDDFQIGVDEALFLTNGERAQRELLEGGDKLAADLAKLEDDTAAVKLAVQTVLTREPSAEEIEQLTKYLATRGDRREQACQQLVWALLTATEFRFNY